MPTVVWRHMEEIPLTPAALGTGREQPWGLFVKGPALQPPAMGPDPGTWRSWLEWHSAQLQDSRKRLLRPELDTPQAKYKRQTGALL